MKRIAALPKARMRFRVELCHLRNSSSLMVPGAASAASEGRGSRARRRDGHLSEKAGERTSSDAMSRISRGT
eukprot:CAMPEP_0195121042 /NCGR_PEP_ID=MMETSP0448-20130528/123330_1 /TAXON_ID=66468 /ORGANISM="Heterocapsa triquestra, Strain CCMP 448" /LENGTH=71 /DNA_ID=CAMNT_0040158505 /DNA_START=27 /DNA_END=239 /DNA_ORIENTATION=-